MACCHSKLARDAIARLRALSGEAKRRAEASNVPELSIKQVLESAKSKPILHRWLTDLLAPLAEEGGVAECASAPPDRTRDRPFPTGLPCPALAGCDAGLSLPCSIGARSLPR